MKKLLVLFLMIVLASCSRTVAIIDGHRITEREVMQRMRYYEQVNYFDTVDVKKMKWQ